MIEYFVAEKQIFHIKLNTLYIVVFRSDVINDSYSYMVCSHVLVFSCNPLINVCFLKYVSLASQSQP